MSTVHPLQPADKLRAFSEETQLVILEALSSRSFELSINPTEHCNFRCTYCYEDFAIGRMRPEIVGGIKKLLARKVPGLRHLRLSWFGGEPLLAASICLDIAGYAMQLCTSHGAQLSGGITTNGSLLDTALAAKLVALNHTQFQISLDGDQPYHDTVRLRADKSGSFDAIMGRLLALRDTDLKFKILLRLHVSGNNQESLRSLLRKLNALFPGDRRFEIGFHPLNDLGSPNKGQYLPVTHQDYAAIVRELRQELPGGLSGYDMVSANGESVHVCYASKPNALFIRADGRIGKCTVALSEGYNNIGRLDSEGQVQISERLMHKWTVGLRTLDPDDLRCPLSRGKEYFESEVRLPLATAK
ncbi:MAG: radical SAM protein [Gammaproteobacteria bacterium]|nr:radical SAM protein [Gammaproteobacteria bacterium]